MNRIVFIFCALWIIVDASMSQNSINLSLTEQIAFSTIQIQVVEKEGSGSGTGFFFQFIMEDKRNIPIIVTNKHVIKSALKGAFILSSANKDGSPNLTKHIPVFLENFESRWILHPDSNIDIAIMPIAPLINEAYSKGFIPFFRTIDSTIIPTEEQLNQLTAVEDILMVGYPIGISDRVNNYPIFRKGITATHPANKYEGRDEFLIDAACFPGSSGSPVFLLNSGNYVTKTGTTVIGTRFSFLVFSLQVLNIRQQEKLKLKRYQIVKIN
jgi:V8-like Glu-specific endopeptidase